MPALKVTPVPRSLPPALVAASPPPPELANGGADVPLAVEGFGDAVVAIPAAGKAPHPVVIAAHANWDRPSWECAWWKRLLRKSFILCPRGILRDDSPSPDDPRYTYESDAALEQEVDAGLAALAERFGAHVDVSPPLLWVALSRGSFLGARIAVRHPERFPRMILVEGGHDPWTPENAEAFAAGGGQAVLFVCGQGACTYAARKAARRLGRFSVRTRLEDVPGMGHGLNGDADEPILEALPWLHGESGPVPW
jgi:pimeloyl-ACP methyl ester carboxylesterase